MLCDGQCDGVAKLLEHNNLHVCGGLANRRTDFVPDRCGDNLCGPTKVGRARNVPLYATVTSLTELTSKRQRFRGEILPL